MQFVLIIAFFSFSILFFGCSNATNILGDKEEQMAAIDEKLESWNLDEKRIACDGCNFTMQEAVSRRVSRMDDDKTSMNRAESGVKVYFFDNFSIDNAFLTLLDSNIFADRITRDFRLKTLDAISSGKNDFRLQDSVNEIGLNDFNLITFAKRLNNTNQPKMILNSLNTMQSQRRTYRYSDSLEGYIVGKQVVILHFYSESQLWSRQ